jgi:hypothetical protein
MDGELFDAIKKAKAKDLPQRTLRRHGGHGEKQNQMQDARLKGKAGATTAEATAEELTQRTLRGAEHAEKNKATATAAACKSRRALRRQRQRIQQQLKT